jgi:hypothetical protein
LVLIIRSIYLVALTDEMDYSTVLGLSWHESNEREKNKYCIFRDENHCFLDKFLTLASMKTFYDVATLRKAT